MGLEVSIGPGGLISKQAWREGWERATARVGARMEPNGERNFLVYLRDSKHPLLWSELWDSGDSGMLDIYDFNADAAALLFAVADETGLGLAAMDAPVACAASSTLKQHLGDPALGDVQTVYDGDALYKLWNDAFAAASAEFDEDA